MKHHERIHRFLRAAALFALLLCACLVTACTEAPSLPQAKQGRLDLSEWDFSKQGAASLVGEWEFVWGRLLEPGDFSHLDAGVLDYLQLPGAWQGQTAGGTPLSATGCGTYRLRLQLPEQGTERLSLLTTGALSVCRIYANGKLLASSGAPACSRGEERPRRHFSLAQLPAGEDLELVVQVSNFHNVQGGIVRPLQLGTTQDIEGRLRFLWLSGALVGGGLLCMSLYHFALFFLCRTFKANLYFGLFCLFWAMAAVFSPTSGYLMDAMGLQLSWSWYVTLALLPYGVTTPLMLLFYQALFPKRFGRQVALAFMLLGLACMAYILATPANAYDPVLFGYFLLTRVAFVYLFAMFIVDALRREQGTLLLAPGYLGLAYAELDEILFDLNVIPSADFGPYGVLIFLLAYSLFVSSRYARAHSRLEQLSQRQDSAGKLASFAGLAGMLDSLEEAVVAVDGSGEVRFCNKAFAGLTGFECSRLQGRHLAEMLEAPQSPASRSLLEALGGEGPPPGRASVFQGVGLVCSRKRMAVTLLVTGVELAEEPLLLVLVRRPATSGAGRERQSGAPVSATMLRDLNANRRRILQLEEAVVSLGTEDAQGREGVLRDLKALDELLQGLGRWLTMHDTSGERRRAAVTVMRLALDCWAAAGKGGKVELAEQSRIWNVYLEKDGYCRTQTLDKYLNLETLPTRPRWRDIHATAEFVLASCDASIPACRRLGRALAELLALS